MTGVDPLLLQHVMVDFARDAPAEHVGPLVEQLLPDSFAATQACGAVLHAAVRIGNMGGTLPRASDKTFYGIQVLEREPGALAALDETGRARHVAVQAFVATLNGDDETAIALLGGPLNGSWHEALSTFHQCLVLWRSAVQTVDPDLSTAILVYGPGDGAPE